jgi:hypothetical protein
MCDRCVCVCQSFTNNIHTIQGAAISFAQIVHACVERLSDVLRTWDERIQSVTHQTTSDEKCAPLDTHTALQLGAVKREHDEMHTGLLLC